MGGDSGHQFKGVMRITRQLLSGTVRCHCRHIINMGSIAGSWPYPGGNVYGATKAFAQPFSRNLRADLSGKQIRDPYRTGSGRNPFFFGAVKGDPQKADHVYTNTQPLTANDIVDIILWIASFSSR